MRYNHTQGPWKVLPLGESKYYGTEVAVGDYCTVVVWGYDDDTPSEREIALGWDDDCGLDHVEKCKDLANARLIAAAPDLFKALDRAYTAMKYSGWPQDSQVLECAEKAIIKATEGETEHIETEEYPLYAVMQVETSRGFKNEYFIDTAHDEDDVKSIELESNFVKWINKNQS